MTVPQLQEKLNQLLKERENAQVAVLNYNGAIAVVQQLLSEEQAGNESQQETVTKAQLPKASKGTKVITLPSPDANSTPSSK